MGSLIPGWEGPIRAERLELRAGYARSQQNSAQPTGFEMIPVLPSLVVPLTKPTGPAWCRGRFEWNPELFFAEIYTPYNRPLYGISLLKFNYALYPDSRLQPYITGAFGGVRGHIDRPETGSDYNFLIQSGIGTRYQMSENTALILEYRRTHISNGGTNERNSGIDSDTWLAGVSYKR